MDGWGIHRLRQALRRTSAAAMWVVTGSGTLSGTCRAADGAHTRQWVLTVARRGPRGRSTPAAVDRVLPPDVEVQIGRQRTCGGLLKFSNQLAY